MKINQSIIKTKIFRNLFFSFSSIVLLILLFFALLVVSTQKDSIIEIMHSEAKTLSNSIALICADAMVSEDDSFIVEHNMAVAQENSRIQSIIISKRNGEAIETKGNQWLMLDTLPQKYKTMEKKSESLRLMKDEFHYVYPVNISGIDWGWIHISYTLTQYNERISEFYNYIAILIMTVFMTLLTVSYFIAKYLATPILQLQKSTKSVAEGNFKLHDILKRDDEISELAENFNEMVIKLNEADQRLKKTHIELEEMVNKRTRELEVLNRELDSRVTLEVAKNREQEQLLIQQSRLAAMGEMIGNIAHQWRQPLNALNLVIQNIYFAHEDGELDDAMLNESVAKSKRLVTAMSQTIDDFRNFFQPNKVIENFNVLKSVNNTIDLISASFHNYNIKIIIDIDKNIYVKGYPNEFSQVILNILSNAKDIFIERGTSHAALKICAFQDNIETKITIEDNGGGIKDSILNKIFDPYFSTKEEGKGTGIGLYMSKMIIENNMNGKLQVKNSHNGAIFSITLHGNDTI